MKILAVDGKVLKIDVDKATALFLVQVDNGPTAKLNLDAVNKALPALGEAAAALKEAAIVLRKQRAEDILEEIERLKKEYEEIIKL